MDFPGLYRVCKNEGVLDTEVSAKLAANMERVTLEEFDDDNCRIMADFQRKNRKMTSRAIAHLLSVSLETVEKWESMGDTGLRFHTWGLFSGRPRLSG